LRGVINVDDLVDEKYLEIDVTVNGINGKIFVFDSD
jgi:hypothetical protein